MAKMNFEKIVNSFRDGKAPLFMLKRRGLALERLGGRDFCFQKKEGSFCPVFFEKVELANNFNDDLSSSWEIQEITYGTATTIYENIYGKNGLAGLRCIIYTDEVDSDLALRGRICRPFSADCVS